MDARKRQVDLSILPKEARKELYDFYEFLIQRYVYPELPKKEVGGKKKTLNKLLPKMVKKFAPLKREEIYAR